MEAKPNSIQSGDTEPIVATLSDADGPVNIAGAGVVMNMLSRVAGSGHAEVNGVCTVLQGLDGNGRITNRGMVQYDWGAGETDVKGVYGLRWRVTFGDGKIRTFPNHGSVTLEIE